MDPDERVTELLRQWPNPVDAGQRDILTPQIYRELHRIAHQRLLRERQGHTLNTTALVHEAYERLAGKPVPWKDRAHFYATASSIMRHILVDYARKRLTEKRGGDAIKVTLEDGDGAVEQQAEDLVQLDEALTNLRAHSPEMAAIVEYRFFGGMNREEIAAAMDIAPRTVDRLWARARAHLQVALGK